MSNGVFASRWLWSEYIHSVMISGGREFKDRKRLRPHPPHSRAVPEIRAVVEKRPYGDSSPDEVVGASDGNLEAFLALYEARSKGSTADVAHISTEIPAGPTATLLMETSMAQG